MSEIRVLPKHLVNKIAAGEVIERPASVVKELVENALDAGARSIDVTVEDGGTRLIAVRDDGAGMGAEDLALAFAPHATSKIAEEQDLFRITSMGFRGEALAAIRAVSQAHILTRRRGGGPQSPGPASQAPGAAPTAEEACGHEIRAEGEVIQPVRPAAAPEGTTVTVRNLFFNTPARRKFLRAGSTEFGHVVEQLCRLALPHRRVAFSLTHNGRLTHRLPAADTLRQRAGDCFGAELAGSLIDFADAESDLRAFGLLAPPSAGRASARWQHFFVNGRYVRDRLLAHALREAYRGLIEPGRCPVGFVFVEMDAAAVDVNVHPAKIEVRFHNGQAVHAHLLGAMREALHRANLSPAIAIDAPESGEEEPEQDARRRSLKQALADFFKSTPPPQRHLGFPPAGGFVRDRPALDVREGPRQQFPPARTAPAAEILPRPAAPPVQQGPGRYEPLPPSPLQREAIQIHNSYIVTATGEGVAIVDQHALHERILFEELTARLARGNLAAQRLLIPQTVEVSQSEKALLSERGDLLARLGVEVTEFGPTSVAVQSFPALLAERKVVPAELLRDLLDLLGEPSCAEGAELLERALATMACKAAIKAGDPLTDEEIHALLSRRPDVQQASSCPHGRPTTLTLSLEELEKQFRRT